MAETKTAPDPLFESLSVKQLLTNKGVDGQRIERIAQDAKLAEILAGERNYHIPFTDNGGRGIVIPLEEVRGETPKVRFYATGTYRIEFENLGDGKISLTDPLVTLGTLNGFTSLVVEGYNENDKLLKVNLRRDGNYEISALA